MKSKNTLTLKDIPKTDAKWRRDIDFFALSYDGHQHKNGPELMNATRKAFEDKKQIPKSLRLNQLRTCLFFEQRYWRHYGIDPDAEHMVYIHNLIEAIRDRVVLKK